MVSKRLIIVNKGNYEIKYNIERCINEFDNFV